MINQLYHPTSKGQDYLESYYDYHNINKTKFYPILIKEWFFLLKKGAYLCIDYKENKILNFKKLEENFWWLEKGKYKIIYHGNATKSPKLANFKTGKMGDTRFICQKLVTTKLKNDSIEKWSFGIVTNGKRLDWLKEIIASIRIQKIPHYEIIICGTYKEKIENDTKYIPFNQRDNQGWITKKKNLIVNKAKYQNICIIHDRVVFGKNWYQGMKKWGNCFELLSCQQLLNKQRTYDYFVHQFKNINYYLKLGAILEPTDWQKYSFQAGQMHIFKKDIMLKNKLFFNETLYWNQAEDIDLITNYINQGYINRFNDQSTIYVKTSNYYLPPTIRFNSKRDNWRTNKGIIIDILRYIYCIMYQPPFLRPIIKYAHK